MLPKALKKKFYEYTTGIERYSAKTGYYHDTITTIAKTDAEAIRDGKKFCKNSCYGCNTFTGLEGERRLLTLNVDYTIEATAVRKGFNDYRPAVKVEKIYKD